MAQVSTKTGTVGELCERWYANGELGWVPSTAYGYRRILDLRILPTFGTTPLRKLRASEIDAWHAQVRKKGGQGGKRLDADTVKRFHAVLHAACEHHAEAAPQQAWSQRVPAIPEVLLSEGRAGLRTPGFTHTSIDLTRRGWAIADVRPVWLALSLRSARGTHEPTSACQALGTSGGSLATVLQNSAATRVISMPSRSGTRRRARSGRSAYRASMAW